MRWLTAARGRWSVLGHARPSVYTVISSVSAQQHQIQHVTLTYIFAFRNENDNCLENAICKSKKSYIVEWE